MKERFMVLSRVRLCWVCIYIMGLEREVLGEIDTRSAVRLQSIRKWVRRFKLS